MKTQAILGRTLAATAVLAVAALALFFDPTTVGETQAAPPSAVEATLDPAMPAFGHQPEASVAEGMRLNGQQVDLRQFDTDEPAESVADYYEEAFRRLRPDVRRFTTGNVTHVSTISDDGRMLTAMIFDLGDRTSVIPGVSKGTIRPGAEANEMPVPIMREPELLLTSATDDGPKHSITAEFLIRRPLPDVTGFYRTELAGLGYRETEGGNLPDDDSNFTLRFTRGNELVTLGVQGLEGETGTVVFLLHETGAENLP